MLLWSFTAATARLRLRLNSSRKKCTFSAIVAKKLMWLLTGPRAVSCNSVSRAGWMCEFRLVLKGGNVPSASRFRQKKKSSSLRQCTYSKIDFNSN